MALQSKPIADSGVLPVVLFKYRCVQTIRAELARHFSATVHLVLWEQQNVCPNHEGRAGQAFLSYRTFGAVGTTECIYPDWQSIHKL